MNYDPNNITWRKGDIVIHDSDAKEPNMLMRVVGYTRDGLVKSQYVDTRRRREVLKNDLQYLHDPSRFGIDPVIGGFTQEYLELSQSEWERVRYWNNHYNLGQRIKTISSDGGFVSVTTSFAIFHPCQSDIWIQPGGLWALKFIEAINAE